MSKNYNKWDIVLIKLSKAGKTFKRPALIISPKQYNSEGLVVILPITSRVDTRMKQMDYYITNWKESGLPKPSLVKLRFATISVRIIDKKIGTLHEEDVFNLLNLL